MEDFDDLMSKYDELSILHKSNDCSNTVCENCISCFGCNDCSYCQECSSCYYCTACTSCGLCNDCNYCYYCTDCSSCECCLFCVGLRVQNNNPEMTLEEFERTPYNKMLDVNKYYVLNEQVSKEEFEQTLKMVMEKHKNG